MTHFATLVIVPADEAEPEKAAAALLAPYDENGCAYSDGSRWDWWQVGGRWTGSLDGYDPRTDPSNIVRCNLCGGTGTRTDIVVHDGCNGCQGSGVRLVWPTNFQHHAGDIQPVRNIPEGFVPAAVVTPDGQWHEEGRVGWWNSLERTHDENDWVKIVAALYVQYRHETAVLVDCHV